MNQTHLFLDACVGKKVPRTPVWMMRQAGRYMPEYRAVRAKHSFQEVCRTPELACEVTMQPINAYPFDAAIMFSDILVVLEALGLPVEYETGIGPQIQTPIRSYSDVSRLVGGADAAGELEYVYQGIKLMRGALADRVPLIGFAGAPYTLATYAIEGAGSKSYPITRKLMAAEPSAAHELLEKLSETLVEYLAQQISAGVQAIQLFDSWAGALSPSQFQHFAFTYAEKVFAGLKAHPVWAERQVPLIYFVNGCAPYLETYRTSSANVLGVDWRISLADAWEQIGDTHGVQGNLDPGVLFAPPEVIRREIFELLKSVKGKPGHIFNLGHGVQPSTNPDHVRVMLDSVHEFFEEHG